MDVIVGTGGTNQGLYSDPCFLQGSGLIVFFGNFVAKNESQAQIYESLLLRLAQRDQKV
ncbi:hypothetical protein [Sneathiella aquimaris]|uniref:hypothetical protein n=1 Tax=Sneathiella aquimaris TaxID=2599305 RepID=UPI00146BCF4B|nr:hypothetical protein [Sneathiella aquimaris]